VAEKGRLPLVTAKASTAQLNSVVGAVRIGFPDKAMNAWET
jgi:hypothetical protein